MADDKPDFDFFMRMAAGCERPETTSVAFLGAIAVSLNRIANALDMPVDEPSGGETVLGALMDMSRLSRQLFGTEDACGLVDTLYTKLDDIAARLP